MLLERGRSCGLGIDALVPVCSWNTKVSISWSPYALGNLGLMWQSLDAMMNTLCGSDVSEVANPASRSHRLQNMRSQVGKVTENHAETALGSVQAPSPCFGQSNFPVPPAAPAGYAQLAQKARNLRHDAFLKPPPYIAKFPWQCHPKTLL